MPGRIEFEVGFTRPEAEPVVRRRGSGSLRILVLGDFSGRANRGLHGGIEGRPAVAVDLDTLESVQERFTPELQLPLAEGGPVETLGFRSLEAFRPESLVRELAPFRALAELRERLRDPARFEAAAAEFRDRGGGVAAAGAPAAAPEPAPEAAPAAEADGDTLARLLGREPAAPSRPRPAAPATTVDISAFIHDLVAPHVAPAPAPGQALYLEAVEAAMGGQLSGLLHHPDFQALEAAWRGLHGLVTGLEGGGEVQVAVLDITLAELAAELEAAAGGAGALERLLVEPADGGAWSLLAGLFEFGADPAALALLGRLGALAGRAGAPFLAAAGSALLGGATPAAVVESPLPLAPEAEAAWQALRRSAVAPWLGLAWPRLLLRLPYGAATDPVEGLAYEELPGGPEEGRLLWGSPALACALLIGRAFEVRGWEMEPGDVLDLGDLPAYVHEQDGLPRLYPCAGAYFGERVMEAVLGRGVMPLVSWRDRNAVRLARFQSIADPVRALAGPWR
jgi:type VI secretion system protein ImpC